MTFFADADSSRLLVYAACALLGLLLSPLAELLIAKYLPRLGPLPSLPIRLATATATGALCSAFALRLGWPPELSAFLLLAVLAVQLARVDIAMHLLPNQLILVLLVSGAGLLLAAGFAGASWQNVTRAGAGAAILFVTYLTMAAISPAAIGMGDVKLAAPVGLYLGYLGWSQLLYGGLLVFVLNGVVSLISLRKNRGKSGSEVPHGPSMLAAVVLLALIWA